MKNYNMKVYSFTETEIDLLTYALGFLAKNTAFLVTRKDALELREYIESLREEKKQEETNG